MNPNLVPTPHQAIPNVAAILEHERWAVAKTEESLIAPNMRPQHVTTDLTSLWRETYPEVRKTLRGRYPKHAWPEDPLAGGEVHARRVTGGPNQR